MRMGKFLRVCAFVLVVVAGASSLLSGQTARRAAAAKPFGAYRIAGTVVNTKTSQPLGRVVVSVTDTKNSKISQRVTTAPDGRFQFQVAAGKYSLQGAKRGFLTYAYEQHENFWTGIVTGAGLDTENLVLRLPPTAMISGKVTDETGDAVRGATVTVFRENHSSGISRVDAAATVATDDLGTYEVDSLGAGTYFVSATAQPWYATHPFASQANGIVSLVDHDLDVAYPASYYKEAAEADEATPIPLRPADQVEVDFHLNPVQALRLVLHGASDVPGAVPVLQKVGFDGAGLAADGRAEQTSPGVYEMVGLAPGKYLVQTNDSSNGTLEGSAEVNLANNGQEVDLSAAGAGATVKLTVQLRGAELPSRLYLGLRDEKGSVGGLSQVGDKGEVVFSGVAAGTYRLVAGSARKSYSVARISSEENEVVGHSLTVAAGASLQATVVLVGGVATVEGVVERGGKAAAAAMVVLVPDDPEANLDLFRRDQSDFDGTFALAQVVPGTYTILAIENGWDLDWAKPAVIESYRRKGQKIVVTEGAKGSVRVSGAVEVQGKL
jgi:Carboxypeptidase regulatory-like domain